MKILKTIAIFCSLFFTIFTNAQTEKGFYASINSGYNIGTGNAEYYKSSILGMFNSTETTSSTSQEIVKVNLGTGINVGANFGYMFNKNIGFELGANYLFGSKIKASQTSYTGDYGNSEVFAKMIQIKPTLVFRSGFEKINPYAKVGMIIGSGKIINTQDQKNGPDTTNFILELDGGTPIGFHASIGTLYKINTKLSLFGEVNLVSLEYAPKKGNYTKYIKNGEDILPLLQTREKEVEFVDSFIEFGEASNPNEPSKAAIIPFSFSSFGIKVGVQYQF